MIADTLKDLGIKRMFGLPGGEVLDLIEACRKVGLDFILTRHETVAAFMADVTGQITGLPGVCVSTVGPGATNLISGVTNAFLDRSPVLAISGQLPTFFHPYANHQFIPLERLFEPITKKVFTFSGRLTGRLVREGFELANTSPKGPVFFCLPSDVAKMEETPATEASASRAEPGSPTPLDEGLISRAVEALSEARRPLAIVGLGADPRRDAAKIQRFIKKNDIPVMVTPKAKGVFPENEPLFLANASGMMADDLVVEMIRRADLVVGIGFDPVESDKIWHKDVALLSFNPYSIRYKDYAPSLELVGPVSSLLDEMMKHDFASHAWSEAELIGFKQKLHQRLTPSLKPRRGVFSPHEVVNKMRDALAPEAVVTTDVGAHKLLLGQAWRSYAPLTFFMSNGFSSMGYGLPAAMAAKLCLPEAEVVCVTGDGGLAMVLQDLETAVRLSLPVVIVVLCDQSLGLIELIQQRRGYPKCGVSFNRIDFAAVARDFGARGVTLNSLEELPAILSVGLGSDRPSVVEVAVDASEYERQL